MKLIGRTSKGGTAYSLGSNKKRVARFANAHPNAYLAKLSAYVDGSAGGTGTQPARGLVFDTLDRLLAVGSEVSIPAGMTPRWLDFPFPSPGSLALGVSSYDFGIQVGAGPILRVYGDDPGGSGGRENTDAYVDGPSDPFGSPTALTSDMSIYATYVDAWVPPDEDEIGFARLPFVEAQRKLSETAPLTTKREGLCAWHGTFLDPEIGSFCVVKRGGALADLLGERIRITKVDLARRRSVVAYVHNEADLLDDLSITRRLFMELGFPSEDHVRVTVQVLS